MAVHLEARLHLQVGHDLHGQPERADQVGATHVRGPVLAHVDPRGTNQHHQDRQQAQRRVAPLVVPQVREEDVEQPAVEGHVMDHMAAGETVLAQGVDDAHEVLGRAGPAHRLLHHHRQHVAAPGGGGEGALHAEARRPHQRAEGQAGDNARPLPAHFAHRVHEDVERFVFLAALDHARDAHITRQRVVALGER